MKVKKSGKKGKEPTFVTKQKVVGTATITQAGTTVKVVITTKKLKEGRHIEARRLPTSRLPPEPTILDT